MIINNEKTVIDNQFDEFNYRTNEWKVKKLKEVVKDFLVPMRDKPKVFDGEIPWCRIEDIEGKWLNKSKSNQNVSLKTIESMKLKVIPSNSVICSCSATLGICAITTRELTTNQTFIGLVPDSEVLDTNFLYYLMKSKANILQNLASGTTIAYLSRKKFEELEVLCPTLKEQQKIAEILSAADEQIEKTEQLIEKTKDLKKGLIQRLFTKGINHTEFIESELGDIPANWKVKMLKEFSVFSNGKAHEKSIEDNGKYTVVNAKFISTNGRVIKKSSKNFSPLLKNDIAMVMSDIPNGKALAKCFLVNEDNKYTLNQRICSIRVVHDDPKYLYYFLNRNSYFLKKNDGVGQTNLRKDEVLNCPVLLPPLEEQIKIADIISTVDKQIEIYENEKEKQIELKKALMQQLLTGKIQVTV